MTFRNFTPHEINLLDENQQVILTIQPEETPIRLSQSTVQVDEIAGVAITETQFGETQGLPEQQEGVYLIVSRLVLSANPERSDLLVPNQLVRDDNGRILGCQSLARN